MTDSDQPAPYDAPGPTAPEPGAEPSDDLQRPAGPHRRRWLIAAVATLVVVALVATGIVVGHAKWHDHQRDVAKDKTADQQDVYLDGVARVDRHVGADISPTLHVLTAMISPRPGDIVAARDALANPLPDAALRRHLREFVALTPPGAWTAEDTTLRKALEEMRDALAGMRRDRNSVDLHFLTGDLQSTQGGMLIAGIDDWRQTVQRLFAARHRKAPTSVARAGQHRATPSMTSWVFGVDRACIKGNLASASLQRAGVPSADDLRKIASILGGISSAARQVPLPKAQAADIRRDVLPRLRVLDSEADALRGEAAAIDRRDLTTVRNMVDRLKTIGGGLPLFRKALRKYGLIACAGTSKAHHGPVST
jgi:hypothetical protein